MLFVTLALKTLVSISQNGLSPITLNKQIDNHLKMHITNASIYLSPSSDGRFQLHRSRQASQT